MNEWLYAKHVAHRGLHNEKFSENTVGAFENAIKHGYNIELDVQPTKDKKLVVYHDNDIQGKNIQTSNYEELKDLRLNNGETLPTLESYLKRACDLEVRLVFELKSHATPERNREAARASVEMIKRMGLEKRTDYISFNLDACKEFIRLCPDASVAYLNGELDPDALKEMGFTGLDYHYNVLREHPEWVEKCKALGLTTNVWTVNEPELIQEMADMGIDFITTDIPEEAREIVNTHTR